MRASWNEPEGIHSGACCAPGRVRSGGRVTCGRARGDGPEEVDGRQLTGQTRRSRYNGRACGEWKNSPYVSNDPQNGMQLRTVRTVPAAGTSQSARADQPGGDATRRAARDPGAAGARGTAETCRVNRDAPAPGRPRGENQFSFLGSVRLPRVNIHPASHHRLVDP